MLPKRFSWVRVWGVVREGLGESEEGIKDVSPLSFPHCFYLCLPELGGESNGKFEREWLGGESKEELGGESKEEFEGENKEELGGENKGNHLSEVSTCKIQELKR
jgi:hypothetical protein